MEFAVLKDCAFKRGRIIIEAENFIIPSGCTRIGGGIYRRFIFIKGNLHPELYELIIRCRIL